MRFRGPALIALLLVGGLALSGCSTFDPTEWFNNKKPLPGERKDLFPEGVPGVQQGVPPELVQGYIPPTEPVPEPLPVPEKPKAKPKPPPKPKPAVAAAPPPPQQPRPQAQGASAPWPNAQSAQPAPSSQSVFPDPPKR